MIKLQEYKIDKNLDSNETYLNLKKFIDEYTNNSTNLNFIKKVSDKFNIPENVIKLKFKRLNKKCNDEKINFINIHTFPNS